MDLIVNGRNLSVAAGTLADLVRHVCQNPAHVITEVNGEIIKAPLWKDTDLKAGDRIELVTFVGGG